LLRTQIANNASVIDLRYPQQVSAQKTACEPNRIHQDRRLHQSLYAFQKHEHGMIATNVIGAAILETVLPVSIGCAGSTMLNDWYIIEGPRLPTLHVSLDFVQGVPTRRAKQATNRIPALIGVDFSRAPNVKFVGRLESQPLSGFVRYYAPSDSKLRIILKLPEASIKVILGEAQIAV
jgi:hypothetical protein